MEPRREGGREIILQLHLIRETGPVQSRQCCQGSTGRGGKEEQEKEEQRGRNTNDREKKKMIKAIQRSQHLDQAILDVFNFNPHGNVKIPVGYTCYF